LPYAGSTTANQQENINSRKNNEREREREGESLVKGRKVPRKTSRKARSAQQ
jgi:hypothetical protein